MELLLCWHVINQNPECKYCSRVAHRVAYTRINCIVTREFDCSSFWGLISWFLAMITWFSYNLSTALNLFENFPDIIILPWYINLALVIYKLTLVSWNLDMYSPLRLKTSYVTTCTCIRKLYKTSLSRTLTYSLLLESKYV